MWNMFKINNKGTRMTSWRLFDVFIVDFEHILCFCSVFIADFEHVNVCWLVSDFI